MLLSENLSNVINLDIICMANYMHIFLEKWNVMLIVNPFYLINLIRLITSLDFQDNDMMPLTKDGRGWVGHL